MVNELKCLLDDDADVMEADRSKPRLAESSELLSPAELEEEAASTLSYGERLRLRRPSAHMGKRDEESPILLN